MAEVDLGTALPLVFGSSGIAAWILTYVQVKAQRKERAQEYFRQMVLTSDFQRYLGLLFSITGIYSKIKSGSDLKQNSRKFLSLLSSLNRQRDKMWTQGTFFFLPDKLLSQVNTIEDVIHQVGDFMLKNDLNAASSAYLRAVVEMEKLSSQLKRFLGIDIIE